ncbi:hypothetical protein J9303_16195 [Bacillaceae bacterium Marseille-Q3522]|nr:hypothetical protein [Bacillaceae bacterium Marseille-Q3522]
MYARLKLVADEQAPSAFLIVQLRALNRTAVSTFESKANCAFGSNVSNILSV